MESKRLVDLEPSSLKLNLRAFAGLGLLRVPTWDEMFQGLQMTIAELPAGFCSFGPLHVLVPEDKQATRAGFCTFYAGLFWAFANVVFEHQCMINIGRILVQLYGSDDEIVGVRSIPGGSDRDLMEGNVVLNEMSGGYHAWSLLATTPKKTQLTEDDVVFVDFGYHWLHQGLKAGQYIPGPKDYLIATVQSTRKASIIYQCDEHLSQRLVDELRIEHFADLLRTFVSNLKVVMRGKTANAGV